jgi:hypothetical protein
MTIRERELEMNTEVRVLNIAELEQVAGAQGSDWKECPYGTKAGGRAGLYPWYANCNPGPGSSYGSKDLGKDIAGAMGGVPLT